jgi:hypothetical protein
LGITGFPPTPSYVLNMNTKQAEVWGSCIPSAETTVNSLISKVCKAIMRQFLMTFRDTQRISLNYSRYNWKGNKNQLNPLW